MQRDSNKKVFFILAILILAFGSYSTWNFYSARVAGDYCYTGGIDIINPKLQLNPPNLSIIIYSLGVIWTFYLLFGIINRSKRCCYKIFGNVFGVIGKYSMDIFRWHLFIQNYLNARFLMIEIRPVKWIIYYGAMFGIPILVRHVYNKIKENIYSDLEN